MVVVVVVLEVVVVAVVVAFIVQPLTPVRAAKAEPSCERGGMTLKPRALGNQNKVQKNIFL